MQALENRLLLDGAPPTPTGLANSGANSCDGLRCQTTLSWSGTYSAGDLAYLEVSTDGLNWGQTQNPTNASTHQMTVNDLGNVPDMRPTYYFRLRAWNAGGG
jgi:hypothetical protein